MHLKQIGMTQNSTRLGYVAPDAFVRGAQARVFGAGRTPPAPGAAAGVVGLPWKGKAFSRATRLL